MNCCSPPDHILHSSSLRELPGAVTTQGRHQMNQDRLVRGFIVVVHAHWENKFKVQFTRKCSRG